MSRENAAAKGRRYVSEGRLVIRQLDEHTGTVQADVRGGGAIYSCGRDGRGWFCNLRRGHRQLLSPSRAAPRRSRAEGDATVRRQAFSSAWWRDASGVRARRATRLELQEAQRLWWRHSDIRESRVRADELRAKRERQGTA